MKLYGENFCYECYSIIKDDIKALIRCLEKEY